MEPAEYTLAEALKSNGYRTGIFGKWHLGDCYPMRPMDQGFDVSLVHRGGGIGQSSDPVDHQGHYTNAVLYKNGKRTPTKGYCTDVYFDEAIGFIKNSKSSGKPFFTYIATNAPHGPFHDVPEGLYKDYKSKPEALKKIIKDNPQNMDRSLDQLARISAMITNIDDNVGKLFEFLESESLLENTLVIFLVDNGPNSWRYVGNLRGKKTLVHEGGIRSPIWFHWPKTLKAGTTVNKVAAHIDIMPTVLEACRSKLTNDVKLDGRSLLGLLKQESVEWPERNIVIQTHRGNRPFRYHHFMIRDSRYKLLHPSGFSRESFQGKPKFELYDLQNDPGESKNLIDEEPEIAKRLIREYDQWFDDVSATRENNYLPPRIIVGSPHERQTTLTRQDWRVEKKGNNVGKWRLDSVSGKSFQAKVTFRKPVQNGVVILQVGSKAIKKTLAANPASQVTFGSIIIPKGHQDISATFVQQESKDAAVAAYQIELSMNSEK